MIASCSREDGNGHHGPVYVSCSLATPARALCAVHSNVVYADSPNEAPLIGASFVVPILPMRQSWDNASAKLRMAVSQGVLLAVRVAPEDFAQSNMWASYLPHADHLDACASTSSLGPCAGAVRPFAGACCRPCTCKLTNGATVAQCPFINCCCCRSLSDSRCSCG